MDMQVVSNMSDELNNELIISENEQLAMTVVTNGESHIEHNLTTMSDQLTVVLPKPHVNMEAIIFPDGESNEHNFPNNGESHGHNFPNNGESHEHNFPNNGKSHGHNFPIGESHAHNFPNGESHHGGHNFPNGHESHEHNNPRNTMSDHDNSFNVFDVASLLAIVDDILTRSTHIIHTLVQGTQPCWERMENCTTPDFNFVSPLCILRKISSELSCKAPGVETAKKTTMAILEKLTGYDWDAKAVITLAALAMEYGNFWVLAQNESNNLLVKSVGVLKLVNGLTMYGFFEENSQAILELNTLINTVRQLIHLIVELWKYKASYNTNDVTALIPAINEIPNGVQCCIITIAAIATQIDSLITFSHQTIHHDLSRYCHKINVILANLRRHFKLIKQQIAEHKYIIEVRKRFQTPTEVLEVFKLLIFSSNAPQLLYHGATKRSVNVEVLREKKVLLFISTLDVTHEEISVMLKLHEGLKANNYHEQYKLVWIPMVEEWTMALRRKMEIVKAEMPWYVVQVQHFGVGGGIIAGHKFIKQDWQFKNTNPMVVVLDHQGLVKHKDAFQFIKVWGMKAFPFHKHTEDEIDMHVNWLRPIIGDIYPTILPWIKEEEKYTLFYGGTDPEWIQKFTEHATYLVNDVVLETNNISMKLFCVEKEEYKSKVRHFWSRIESHFTQHFHDAKTTMEMKIMEEVTQEVHKIMSYKLESGWALLTKGSTVILSGNWETVLTTVKKFNEWKETVTTKGFAVSFKEHHAEIERGATYGCSKIDIQNVAGKLPDIINCPTPYCHRNMNMISVAYKCCHKDPTAANATMH